MSRIGSITYQFKNCKEFRDILEKIFSQQKASVNAKKLGVKPPQWEGPTMETYHQYLNHAIKFGEFCKETYGIRYYDDCRSHIQDYADWLVGQGKSASTVHSYLAGVCAAFGVSLAEIKHPIRHTANNIRSRGTKASDKRRDRQRACSPRLCDFACHVGIRRDECAALRGNDLTRDESGYLCVLVRKGKGGKRQLQRVPPGSEDFVAAYFDGSSNFVFSKAEMNNKIDLHHYRHYLAWEAYQGYQARLEADPGYREQLIAEIKIRWQQNCKKPWNPRQVEGWYRIRGKNKALSIAAEMPDRYSRLALAATSIFHLSHWRLDVSVSNYLLAVAADKVSEKEKEK